MENALENDLSKDHGEDGSHFLEKLGKMVNRVKAFQSHFSREPNFLKSKSPPKNRSDSKANRSNNRSKMKKSNGIDHSNHPSQNHSHNRKGHHPHRAHATEDPVITPMGISTVHRS
jgi:hypothetical protein